MYLLSFSGKLATWPIFAKKLSKQSVSHNLTTSQGIWPETTPVDAENLTGLNYVDLDVLQNLLVW